MTDNKETDADEVATPEFSSTVKRPPSTWTLQGGDGSTCEAYGYAGFTVISRVGRRKDVDPPSYFWWIEIFKDGKRPTDKQCARVCRAFGMKRAEEMTGKGPQRPSRHFTLPVKLN